MKNASLVAQAIYDAQNDTENAELAETLKKGLKINTQAYQMKRFRRSNSNTSS